MIKVESFSKGKVEERNEDYFDYNNSCFVLVDGATDKSGKKYDGKTGGELLSRIVTRECLLTNLNGIGLVKLLNNKINALYKNHKILKYIKDAKYRFTGGFICIRIQKDELIITYLGDLGFRINGDSIYQEVKRVDIDNSEKRAKYIEKTNDIEGSCHNIHPFIIKQYEYQNKIKNLLGYGVLDGTYTPKKFIKLFKYKKDDIKTIEMFTDGYCDAPKEITIEAWEKMYEEIEKIDPHKYIKYKSTKSTDDRTIAIIRL